MNSQNWDAEVVRDLFSLVDVAIILGIPINQSAEGDSWYWFDEKDGIYFVRSAYKMTQEHKTSPITSDVHVFWKKLWSLKVPPKAKDLIWRADSNCLPTKVNLCIKKVLFENTCPMCAVYAETELHLLVTCQFAGSCWEAAAVANASRNNSSLLHWLDFNANYMDSEKLGRLVMLCWALWNSNGELISVFAGVKIGRVSPELAEAMGIREALSWLKDHEYTRAEVETDSLVCVEAIRSTTSFTSSFELIVEDCKTILKSLINVSIFFVKRSANRVAYFVARHSMIFAECMFPLNSVPLELLSILLSDSSS
uniref:RNase H type-1 domain-containing protein n=1 Tax=Cannabis sativa TaxID=3483 RepID=A0A803QMV6_CANSA